MTRIRRLGALTLVAPLAMGFTILGAPSSNAAAALTLSPSNGAVVTAAKLVVKGSVGGTDQARLTFNGLSYEGKGSVSRTFDAHEMRNGSYTAKIEKKVGLVWWDNKSATFSLRTAPYSPKGVSAKVSGGKLKVSWNLGPEPDLTGYDVTAGGVGTKTGSVGSLCGGTVCSASFSIPSGASGRVSVVLHARRSTGSGGTVGSAAAGTAVTLPNSSAGSGGGGGATTPGGYPNLGAGTPLLPLTENSPLSLPPVTPDGATPGFQYPTPVPDVAPQNPVAAPDARTVAAIDNVQWGKSIASALILLIVAAHLGTWTRRVRVATGPMAGRGMSARISRAGSGRARVRMARASIAHAEAAAKAAVLSQTTGKGRAAAKVTRRRTATKPGRGHAESRPDGKPDAALKAPSKPARGGSARGHADKPAKQPAKPASKASTRSADHSTGTAAAKHGLGRGRRRAK